MSSPAPDGPSLRVALVDGHAFTRQCLCDLLHSGGVHAFGLADVDEATAGAADQPVDAVVLRLDAVALHDRRFLDAMERLHQAWPRAALLVLAPFAGTDAALEVVRLGFSGCLSPAMSAGDLAAALRLVVAGAIFVGPGPAGACRPAAATPALTPREAEVLAVLRQGKPNKVIAFELDMAENTVKVHVARILRKLGAANRTAVANLDAEAFATRRQASWASGGAGRHAGGAP